MHNLFSVDSYASFSGADTTIVAGYDVLGDFIEIGNIQTLSYSIHAATDHVRALGFDTAKGFTKGQKIVAGTVVFTVLNKHVLSEVFELLAKNYDKNKQYGKIGKYGHRIDQLPPMTIKVFQWNDYGHNDEIHLYGVEFVNEGQVMSIHDIITENTVNYFARDIRYINPNVNPDTEISNKADFQPKISTSNIENQANNFARMSYDSKSKSSFYLNESQECK